MPELPDLQVFSKNLTKMLKGKTVKEVAVYESKKLHISEKELKKALEGKTLKKVYRTGKQLYFDFGKDAILSLHLMLHGKLVYSEEQKPKYTLYALTFENGNTLAITDYQKVANIHLDPESKNVVDALSEELDATLLYKMLQESKAIVKTFLMDQHLIGGIGNAYADEILWEAGIAPKSISNRIPKKQATRLAKAIKRVLHNAEKQIQKEHPDIISGEIRDFMKVHNSKAKTDPDGKKILNEKIGGRTTYYSESQELYT